MPSTYTTNLGIEKVATGEQSGVWGSTTNTNLDIIDQAVNGIVSITLAAAGSSGSPNSLAISNGALSDGRNKFIEYTDGGDLGATAYVQLVPNDAEKIVIIRNSLSGSQNLIIFQGTYNASNDFEIPNGKEVVLKFSGTGTGATVTQVFEDLKIGGLSADSATLTTADINGGTVDGATIGGASAAAGTFTTLTATTLGGALDANNENITNVDIDSGAIDGTTIGASSAAAGTFTTLTGTTLGGALDANNQAITNVDINSGAIDGTTIGASSAAAGTFSSVTATTADINGGTIDGVSIGATTPATSIAATTADINGGTLDGVSIGATTPATTLDVDNIKINGSTISSTNTNGAINLTPDGTGDVNISKVDINGGTIDGATIGTSSPATVRGTVLKTSAIQTKASMSASDVVLVLDGEEIKKITQATLVNFTQASVQAGDTGWSPYNTYYSEAAAIAWAQGQADSAEPDNFNFQVATYQVTSGDREWMARGFYNYF